MSDEIIHDLPAGSPMNRGWRKHRQLAPVVVTMLLIVAFSLVSYAGWDLVFHVLQGECLGPVCITGPP